MNPGRTLALVLAVTAAIPALSARQGTAVLTGTVVVDEPGGGMVRRAVVTLNLGADRGERQTLTDDEGRFVLSGLPPGRFLVSASKPGWVTTHYGSTRPGRPPGMAIALTEGQQQDITIPLLRGGVIAGRVVDGRGRPMARQWPWLLEYRTIGGQRVLSRSPAGRTIGTFERSTDDRGEFRLFGLPPGTYYLRVSPSVTAGTRLTTAEELQWAVQAPGSSTRTPADGPSVGYAPVFYPGTPDPSAAEAIVVGPGQERVGLSISVPFVRTTRLEGVATRPDGRPAARATIQLATIDRTVLLEGSSRRTTADGEGRFVIAALPPGRYRIVGRSSELWGEAVVTAGEQDTTRISLPLEPASIVSGRLRFVSSGRRPPDDLSAVRLRLVSSTSVLAALAEVPGSSGEHPAAVAADRTFVVRGLGPDHYVFAADWPGMRSPDGAGWWLSAVTLDGRDVSDTGIEVAPNASVGDVVVTFSDRAASISGQLIDGAGRPAPEYFVYAFAADCEAWTPIARRAPAPVRPATDGRYQITGLPPGGYYLAVLTTFDEADLSDPAFLDLLIPSAVRLTLGEGEQKTQDLKLAGG